MFHKFLACRKSAKIFISCTVFIVFTVFIVSIIDSKLLKLGNFKENMITTKQFVDNNQDDSSKLPGGPAPELIYDPYKFINDPKPPTYTHLFTTGSPDNTVLDTRPEKYIKGRIKTAEDYQNQFSEFTNKFTCYSTVTGMFEDCGPLAYNGCSGLNYPINDTF